MGTRHLLSFWYKPAGWWSESDFPHTTYAQLRGQLFRSCALARQGQWGKGQLAPHVISGTSTNLTTHRAALPLSHDAYYVHTQNSASAFWTVRHNLNKCPSVTVVDTGGTEIEADAVYVSNMTLTIAFLGATSGWAYCN